jgi:hypothetical protein
MNTGRRKSFYPKVQRQEMFAPYILFLVPGHPFKVCRTQKPEMVKKATFIGKLLIL